MKNKSIIVVGLVVSIPLFVLMGTSLASAQGSCMKYGNMGKHHPDTMAGMPFSNRMGHEFRMIKVLELSKEQREKIWSIQDKIRPQMRTHRLALFEGRKQLREIVNSDYDQNKIQKLANEQGETITALIMLQTDTRHRIHSVLTPEQRNKLKEFRGKGNVGLQRMTKTWMR